MVETGEKHVLERQLDLAFSRLPAVLVAYPIVGVLVCIPLRDAVSLQVMLAWVGCLCVVAVGGIHIEKAYRKTPTRDLRLWSRVRVVITVVTGLVWGGALSTFLYVPHNPLLENFVVFVVGGTAVVALSSTSSHRPSLFVFQLANNVPLIARLFSQGDEPHLAMAGLILAFLSVVLVIGNHLARNVEQLIRTEADNTRLVVDLSGAHQQLSQANAALSQRVEERTAQLSAALAEKEAREAQLRQAERMEAVGRLAGSVAHDFGNVLTGITGFATLVDETLEKDDERRSDLAEILDAAGRASQLTRQLLGFAKGGLTEPQVIDLSAQLLQLDKMLRRLVFDNVELNWVLPEGPVWLFLDPVQLDQLVINLVVNGRDAMPDGGTLTVSVERKECVLEPGAPETAVRTPCAVIRVQDTGPGVDPELVDRVFEPFVATKGEHGTGLGLATCFGIVRRAGGTIQLTSTPGEGSLFTIQLPLTTRTPVTACGETEELSLMDWPGASILVVEDQPAIQKMVARTLRAQGYKVFEALSAEQALAQVVTRGLKPDLVLSDVVLPHMSGFDLRDALVSHGTQTKFLMMSGYIDEASLRRKDLGVPPPLVTKPFSTAQLLKAVAAALGPATSRKVSKGHLRSV